MPRADSPYGRDWQKLRARFLHHHKTCRLCAARAVHVDHIIPIRQAPERRLDWTNLQALCTSHHNQITNAFDVERERGCDENGRPFSREHPWAGDPATAKSRMSKQDWVRSALKALAGGKIPGQSWRDR